MTNGITPPGTQQQIVSWVHVGDLHMTTRDEQNYRNFQALVDEVNSFMRHSINFVYLPGDNADHGKRDEYQAVREGLDGLSVPWFSILGDHDVQSRSFDNYLRLMSPRIFYTFTLGGYRFSALNACDAADPGQFDLTPEQLVWLEQLLAEASENNQPSILFLHVYPSELNTSAQALSALITKYRILLVDMGHTHYNEIANDGSTLYTTTRSTGQVEEGPVGFSVTNLDQDVVSWRFKELGAWPLVMITTPADERLITDPHSPNQVVQGHTKVRVKAWSNEPVEELSISVNARRTLRSKQLDSSTWEADWDCSSLPYGPHTLRATARNAKGKGALDEICVIVGFPGTYRRKGASGTDQDNAIGAWIERGILGTQLGPNKNGHKW